MQVHFSCDDVPADLLTAKFSRLQTRGFHGHSVRFSYANEKVCQDQTEKLLKLLGAKSKPDYRTTTERLKVTLC